MLTGPAVCPCATLNVPFAEVEFSVKLLVTDTAAAVLFESRYEVSPLYCAVTLLEPIESDEVVRVAVPPVKLAGVPNGVVDPLS